MPPIPEPSRAPIPSSEIAAGFERLGVVGSVLYVAAHPDDENTRLLAWLHGDRHLSAAYMSLTRGDGGQNLIGAERGSALGLIRTFELLAARNIDGASQFFSRATDFGYSKSADETFKIWPRAEVLGDLVKVIRYHAPDLIITRFSTEPPNHGHHTASAILAREAFALAADPKAYPEQLKVLAPHQAMALFENKSHWRFKEGEDLSAYLNVDVGTHDALTGRTFTEVAARSRSQHKSQGFGSAPVFGVQREYFQVNAVAPGLDEPKSLLADRDFAWSRFPNTEAVQKAHALLVTGFDVRNPSASVPRLLAFMDALDALPRDGLVGHYRNLKLMEAGRLVAACLGLLVDASTAVPVAATGDTIDVKVGVFAPPTGAAAPSLTLKAVHVGGTAHAAGIDLTKLEKPAEFALKVAIGADPSVSPEAIQADPRPVEMLLAEVRIGTRPLVFAVPIRYVHTDPVAGELREPLVILPPVTVTPDLSEGGVVPSPNARPVTVAFRLEAHGAARKGMFNIPKIDGFKVAPDAVPFTLAAGESRVVEVTVSPIGAGTAVLRPTITLDGGKAYAASRLDRISYAHLPQLSKLGSAEVSIAAFPFAAGKVKRVGYIAGAADEVAASLTRVGYEVVPIDLDAGADPKNDPLKGLDAVIVGIRALNVNPGLDQHHERLMRWVAAGGTLIWQYNVSSRFRPLGPVRLGPAALEIGPDRVTDEGAAMEAVDSPIAKAVLAKPNRIEADDFRGWVQERGLYFASKWEAPWASVFRIADPGEGAQEGGLVIAQHGRGHVVYTGLAFFRQLPAGVPGAFRLFANLVAL